MSVVKINAITVPAERADEMAARFAARAGQVGKSAGFEEFQLLRPTDDRTTWLVYTRWQDEESFQAWMESQAFSQDTRAGPTTGRRVAPSPPGASFGPSWWSSARPPPSTTAGSDTGAPPPVG